MKDNFWVGAIFGAVMSILGLGIAREIAWAIIDVVHNYPK